MAVPGLVGDKYCNGFEFKWQYWHVIRHTIGSNTDWSWTADNRTYWTHYKAACRTNAKKSSVALWNGGLFIGNDSVSAPVTSRYENAAVGTITADGGALKRFDSWSEHLANVNDSIGDVLPGVIPGSAMWSSSILISCRALTRPMMLRVWGSRPSPNSGRSAYPAWWPAEAAHPW